MFPGTDHMTAVPLVNRSVDSDVIATRTNRTQIDIFLVVEIRHIPVIHKKAFQKSAKLKFSGIKIWIIFIQILKINFSQIILVDKISVQILIYFPNVTAPKAFGQIFFHPKCVMMNWIFGDVGRIRYFGTFSAKDKCSGEKRTPHNLQLNGLSPGNQV